ncbi:MAG: hypothetical protein LBC94_04100 [Desulfovibrio sp.]|jgi:hypothetical protein|nr:hypothetical protein [Desulfovibrio sp.]
MPKTLCLLHANCQGQALRPLLENSPAFARLFHLRHYTNYTREVIERESLRHCGLFLYQRLGARWGEFSTEHLLSCLPSKCQCIEIPNFFFKGYWPTWTHGDKSIDFADSLLNALLERGLALHEALRVYLRAGPALLGDAAAVAEESLGAAESREAACPVRCTPLLRERWREEQMFLTINHPGRSLLFHLADGLLGLLGLGCLPEAAKRVYRHPDDDFWLPIHPLLKDMLGLPFVRSDRRYPVFAASLTHREYTGCYLACRAQGVKDLVSFLRNLPRGFGTEVGRQIRTPY